MSLSHCCSMPRLLSDTSVSLFHVDAGQLAIARSESCIVRASHCIVRDLTARQVITSIHLIWFTNNVSRARST